MRLKAESEIRKLLAVSSDCVWRKDLDQYGLCWSINGEWRILGSVTRGREAIKTAWWRFMDPLRSAWQVAHNLVLEIEDHEAQGRLFIEETLVLADGTVHLTRGIYHDTYVIEEDRWTFGKRHFDLVYIGPPAMSGRFFSTVPYGPAPTDPDPNRPATPSFQEVYG
jgi:hypothetical protein